MTQLTSHLQLLYRTALLLWSCGGLVLASALPADVERDRIAQARAQVQAIHDKDITQCKHQFAVTDCEQRVSKIRRTQLDQLNREELVLKDQERKRKAAKQQKKLDDKAKLRASGSAQEPSPESKQRIKIAKPKALPTQSAGVEQASTDAEKQSEIRYQDKLRATKTHQEKVQQSGSLRFKPAASSLPVPK